MKDYLKLGAAILIVAVLFTLSTKLLTDGVNEEVAKYENKVGERVVLKTDTLMIIDYSLLKNNFTLEDGREISFDLVDKLECVGK